MLAYYGTQISPNQFETAEGFLICKNVPIARTGEQIYRAADLQLDGDPDRAVTVYREETEVFDPAAMASFEGKSVTDEHPPEEVTPYNFGSYEKGHIENVRRSGDYLLADLFIKDAKLISDVQGGVKREVSCGYMCTYTPDKNGYKQEKIRGNHVAVVHRGRAGHNVAIKDSADNTVQSELPNNKEKGGKTLMGKFTEDILKLFGAAAKDAKPEEIKELATATAVALDAAPAETEVKEEVKVEALEAEPAKDEEVIKAPEGDDIGTKLDKVIEMLASLKKDENADKKEEEKISDETDLDKIIAEKEEKEEKLEEVADGGEAEVIKADACGKDGEEVIADDAAILNLIKALRPAVAKISDKNDKAMVTDALLGMLKKDETTGKILKTTADAAQSNAQKMQTYEQRCGEQKSIYDSFNPHKIKEDK